jgi:hypothetical protein
MITLTKKGGEPFPVSVPEYKGYTISRGAATKISEIMGCRCIVITGIHVEDVTKSDIEKLRHNSDT